MTGDRSAHLDRAARHLRRGVVPTTESFSLESTYGEIVSCYRPHDLAGEIDRLSNPATATETIHWGRNYLYRTHLETPDGPLDVVVKQFRNQGFRQRLLRRWRGSKATRSWRIAQAFLAAKLPTAQPILLIESKRRDGPSFFVTRLLPNVIEARHIFRAVNRRLENEAFPKLDLRLFFETLGGALRRMHDAGFFHRDLSIGNVLLSTDSGSVGLEGIYFVDLNRAQQRRRLSLSQRTRDLCRLAIFRPAHQRLFLTAYWGTERLHPVKTFLYRAYHHGFRLRIESKKRVRSWTRRLVDWLRPRRAHAHIPAAPSGASRRDKIVWDHLSDQPHQHAGKLEKMTVRLIDAPSHLRQTAAFVAAAPALMRRYRQLRRELHQKPVPWHGVGICIRPLPEAPDQLLSAIEDLGIDKILLRLHPWDDDHTAEERLARELARRGYELAFALPQNRDLVRDPARWQEKIAELAERFTPFGRHFQIGQAINRSKWGIWRYGEYLDLASSAASILRRYPEVEILGPAVIDFEYHVTASILNLRNTNLYFDILSSLLYVDRRGAPERSQLGFDTVGKAVLLQAIAETARNCGARSWVTEVNWPLWEGPHSPAGRTVSVDQEVQADFLVRYYLLALTTGAVERVYWWQLVARGYGLATPQPGAGGKIELRRRPGFYALATLVRELRDSVFIHPIPSPPQTYLYRFSRPDRGECIAAWSADGHRRALLPRPASTVTERDGNCSAAPQGREIELSSSVRFFRF